jgi:putative nucleotidyltransferase with HDIG domain
MVRLLLTALDRDKVGEVVLDNLHAVVACDCTGLSFMTSETAADTLWRLHIGKHVGTQDRSFAHLQEGDLLAFKKMPESLRVDSDRHFVGLLAPMRGCGVRTFFVLPLVIDGRLTAVLTLGYLQAPANSREDLVRARQLADQIAVALFNASLIEDLAGLNWGTLTALARAVDAKSSWTAGHSERVTNFALELGQVMGLPSNELELLQRGGLLHDIGKIGVPGTLLDKPGNLTDEEYAVVKTHPEKGGRILEPIPAYADVIPLVVQHHERFDGRGYPYGLAGEAISLGGRIMAVADVYDALISDRPYREGWLLDRVISHIEHEAGHQFDPRVVEAFLWIMDSRGRGVARASEQTLSLAL